MTRLRRDHDLLPPELIELHERTDELVTALHAANAELVKELREAGRDVR